MIIRKYILSNLSQTFFPIFFTLFVISAVIMLLKIAALTSFIKLDLSELFTLFMYKVPQVIFNILSLSLFSSAVITVAKLSSGNELIVINSLGVKPIKIMRIFLLITAINAILCLILSISINEKTHLVISYVHFKAFSHFSCRFHFYF